MNVSLAARLGCFGLVLGLVTAAGCREPLASEASPAVAKVQESNSSPGQAPSTPTGLTPVEPSEPAGTPQPVGESPSSVAPPDSDPPASPRTAPPADEPPAKPKATDEAPAEPKKPPVADDVKFLKGKRPFNVAVPMEDFPKDLVWLNTAGPLRKKDLKGKFVILDFWTYCCINCIHILPELKKLEQAYPNNLVVIGVHSAKFDGEKDSQNIEGAILRYDIEHPVINDAEHKIWDGLGVQSWPTALMIDPEGFAVWGRSGEFKFDEVDRLLKGALPYYRDNGLLDETPIRFDLLAERQAPTPLRYPGKVMADEKSERLFITDSNHHRIVICSLEGKLLDIIGSGALGRADGDFASATFHHPQGLALSEETLYVADTENHLLRKVDLKSKQVSTIGGTGEQSRGGWPGAEGITVQSDIPDRWVAPPKVTALNSPWDLWVHGGDLYIAMAGPHQIWKMPLDETEIGPFAGNGREDIVDGPLLPRIPYDAGFSSFAQPSGLSSDGKWLYVADSEGSSVRAVPLDGKGEVKTVVGTAHLRGGRLFAFGDKDGSATEARLQHALGVAYHDKKIYVADTYNNKIKVVDAATGKTRTLAGSGDPGKSDETPVTFDEPAGITFAQGKLFVADTNNHLIRVVDPKSGEARTLTIEGLAPPKLARAESKPDLTGATELKIEPAAVKAVDGKISLNCKLELPAAWKINSLAPMNYYVEAEGESMVIDRQALGKKRIDPPATEFSFTLPVKQDGEDQLKVSLRYYYCEEGGEGICKVGAVVFRIPLKVAADAGGDHVKLSHSVSE